MGVAKPPQAGTNMPITARPFSSVEWLLAWRYLRARRAEGGVSAISWIALIGVALGVFAMIATFSVREGFRGEYVRTILGNEGHASIYPSALLERDGVRLSGIENYTELAGALKGVEGVERAVPIVMGQVIATRGDIMKPVQIIGMAPEEYSSLETLIENPESAGDAHAYGGDAIALGRSLAYSLGVGVGDKIEFTTIGRFRTVIGFSPRVYIYDIAHIFSSGNDYVDGARAYVPIEAAQSYLDMEGLASQIEVDVANPHEIEASINNMGPHLGVDYFTRSWKEKNARVLSGLQTEDNLMFILTSILVLVATFTIVAGQIMLVKNKTRDIAILRTMGFSRGAITRIFFLVGVILGVIGTLIGVLLGTLFSIYFTPIFHFVNFLIGGGAENTWALSVIPNLKAELTPAILVRTVFLALFLSFLITYLPARSAARLDPAEALRHG